MSSLQLFAVAGLEHGDQGALAPETDLVVYRDLGAVVRPAAWVRPAAEARDVDEYRGVIEAVFARRPVLPAPVGTLFRSRLAVQQWLELHYASLSDGIGYVEGRAMARVHVRSPAAAKGAAGEDAGSALFREMRRHAVSSIPHARTDGAEEQLVGSFLVERERWRTFEEAALQLDRQTPALTVRITGPWPPYDFVRLQFGG